VTKTVAVSKPPLQSGDPIKVRSLSLQTSWVTTVYVAWDSEAQVFYLLVNARVFSSHATSQEAEKAYKKLVSRLAENFQAAIQARLKD
jgi:hypothetical protein